jgi:GDSL-like Lipase/Acylhydrolase family
MRTGILKVRGLPAGILNAIITIISLVAAFGLRFNSLSDFDLRLLIVGLTVMLPAKSVIFFLSELPKGWTQPAGPTDIARIFLANTAASGLSLFGIFMWVGRAFPRSVYVIDFMLSLLLCIGIRFAGQLLGGSFSRHSKTNTQGSDTIETIDRFPRWIPNLLLSLTTLLLMVSGALGIMVFRLATRPFQLEDLSAVQRQTLIQLADQIVPPVYQPFPLGGPLLFYHMRPNTNYVNVLGDTFTTNDLGFRTVPTTPKPSGVKRIVIVGDSWTYGQGVRYEQTFTNQLQKMLNRGGERWQVYNLAMPGWNTANQISALRVFFSRLQPDIVVFCPTSNDIDDSLEVWNGRLLRPGFSSGAMFRSSYEYESRWVDVFKRLQSEVEWLRLQRVPSLVYFLAEWRKLAPYYAGLARFYSPYTVVPTEYIEKHRLSKDTDAGEHATPNGHELIATHLHNALLEEHLITGLDRLPSKYPVVFPGDRFAQADVDAELRSGFKFTSRAELLPLTKGFMGKEGIFSVEAPSQSKTVYVQLALIDIPGLYPLTVEIALKSREKLSSTRVFDRFVAKPELIEIRKPSTLDRYPIIEVHITADRVVASAEGLTPISMKRPDVRIR